MLLLVWVCSMIVVNVAGVVNWFLVVSGIVICWFGSVGELLMWLGVICIFCMVIVWVRLFSVRLYVVSCDGFI